MRIALLSDVHANIEALEAVLSDARREGVDATWVLGDIVGYGADPGPVLERLSALPEARLLAGNHDLAAVDLFDPAWFNKIAAEAIRWTAGVLSGDLCVLLRGLEPRARASDGSLLVHGSVVDPVAEYVINPRVAVASFEAEGFEVCFFGHTHIPSVFVRQASGVVDGGAIEDGVTLSLDDEGARFMVNPGSVGQPRDGDPRAAWALYEPAARTVTFRRVGYEIERAQEKIRAAGLPGVLADRLSAGR